MRKSRYLKIDHDVLKRDDLSIVSKVLYALIVDRIELSSKNNEKYTDKNDRVFCYMNIDDLELYLTRERKAIYKAYRELESHDLIRVKRQGQSRPNRIYLIENGDFKKSQNGTSRSPKMVLQEVPKTDTNELDLNKLEGTKKKEREEKSLSPFFTRARSDVIDLVCEMIGKRYLIHMMDDAKAHASNYYADRQQKKWTIGKKRIMTDDDMGLDLDKWNHKEWKFKRGGEVTKGKGKKQGEPDWMDDVIDGFSKMEG